MFAFQSECEMAGSVYDDARVTPGALIHVLQKGVALMSMEYHVQEVCYLFCD
jgi:hypothetical protein